MAGPSRLVQSIARGLGAGLLAGAAVGLTEVLILVGLDRSARPVEGLLYAVVAYGLLGLAAGLALGLASGAWGAFRGRDIDAWAGTAALVFGLGLWVVVRNRLRHDVLYTAGQPWSVDSLALDGLLFVAGLLVALVVWRLLRQRRWPRRGAEARWSLAVYAVALVAAALLSAAPALADTLVRAGATPSGIPPDLRDRPNARQGPPDVVVFIVADTLRADHLSCYAQRPAQLPAGVDADTAPATPRIDALAGDGVLYREMQGQASWTRPSAATMLTSLYPSSHRAITQRDLLPDAVTTLPEVLQAQGYHTAGFTTNIQVSPAFNFQQGYDEYEFLTPSYPFFASPTSSRFAVYSLLYALRRPFVTPAEYAHNEFYQDAEVLTARARSWLQANRDTRFFLYLHYMDQHQPYYAHPYDGHTAGRAAPPEPPATEAPAMLRLYDGEIAFLDTHLGALFDELKALGLYDDALIVFTADHGEEFVEHGWWGHGTTLYQEQIAVPLIIKYPGHAEAGQTDVQFARSLDIAPTILDVLELPIPEAMQGLSLRPLRSARPADQFAEEDREGHVLQSIRIDQFKLVLANPGNPRGLPAMALFDLHADPGEQHNLADATPDTVAALRARLDRVLTDALAHAVEGQSRELDAATRQRLQQLGY
ncbi:MAG: sulfatase-like hydrolase/transferase [Chloroflexi bacterium]|nr:sulfatase-like hydrolase/transferase [Chloroflexota bacterium]